MGLICKVKLGELTDTMATKIFSLIVLATGLNAYPHHRALLPKHAASKKDFSACQIKQDLANLERDAMNSKLSHSMKKMLEAKMHQLGQSLEKQACPATKINLNGEDLPPNFSIQTKPLKNSLSILMWGRLYQS